MPLDIQQYLDDPSTLDMSKLSPEERNELMTAMGVTIDEPAPAPKVETPAPKVEAEPAKEEARLEPDKPSVTAKEEPTVVLAPDGKSTIPYSVLRSERDGRSSAEKALAEAQRTIDELNAQLKSGKEESAPKDDVDAEIAALEDEAPALAKIARALLSRTKAAEDRVAEVERERSEENEVVQKTVQQQVDEAIDSNPALVHWRANNEQLWEEAKAFDRMLRTQPHWEGKPFADRFAKVVQLVVADHGDAVLPSAAEGKPPAKAVKPEPTAEEVKAAAKAKLKETAPQVATLTDVPGGALPEQTEQQMIENMSAVQLGSQFEKWTPEQRTRFLAQFS